MIRKPKGLGEYAAMLGIWVGLLLLFGILSQNFLTARTLGTVANRIPTHAVVAAGMTLVLIIATLATGLAQVGASEPAKRVITGAVIVVAVILDAWRHQMAGCGLSLTKCLFFPSE